MELEDRKFSEHQLSELSELEEVKSVLLSQDFFLQLLQLLLPPLVHLSYIHLHLELLIFVYLDSKRYLGQKLNQVWEIQISVWVDFIVEDHQYSQVQVSSKTFVKLRLCPQKQALKLFKARKVLTLHFGFPLASSSPLLTKALVSKLSIEGLE